jgi:RecB family exonuclease
MCAAPPAAGAGGRPGTARIPYGRVFIVAPGDRRGQDEGVEQLGFAEMPPRLYPCTPTRLSTWLDCPRRYRMSYLDRPPPAKGPPWAHNSLGASVHNALAGWWRLPPAARTPDGAADLLERCWIDEGYADQAQSGSYRRWARRMVQAYVTRLDPASEPAGVERTVATRTDRIAISGRIDRLDDRPSGSSRSLTPAAETGARELVVVDYKTGRHRPTVDDARSSLPLALYALAARRVMRRPCYRVELHHIPSGQVVGWDHSDESLSRQLRRAEDIAAECAAADERYRVGAVSDRDEVFPPRPGPGCGWCDFRRHCPEGQAVSQPRQPWDGLAALGEPVVPP